MKIKHGEHQRRTLKYGVVGHFFRRPRSRVWRISSADISWWEGRLFQGLALMTRTWRPQNLGWKKLKFETPDEAGAFIESKIRTLAS